MTGNKDNIICKATILGEIAGGSVFIQDHGAARGSSKHMISLAIEDITNRNERSWLQKDYEEGKS